MIMPPPHDHAADCSVQVSTACGCKFRQLTELLFTHIDFRKKCSKNSGTHECCAWLAIEQHGMWKLHSKASWASFHRASQRFDDHFLFSILCYLNYFSTIVLPSAVLMPTLFNAGGPAAHL